MEYATTDKFRLDSETVESLATAKGGWTALAFKFIVGENENWPPKKSGWKVRYLAPGVHRAALRPRGQGRKRAGECLNPPSRKLRFFRGSEQVLVRLHNLLFVKSLRRELAVLAARFCDARGCATKCRDFYNAGRGVCAPQSSRRQREVKGWGEWARRRELGLRQARRWMRARRPVPVCDRSVGDWLCTGAWHHR